MLAKWCNSTYKYIVSNQQYPHQQFSHSLWLFGLHFTGHFSVSSSSFFAPQKLSLPAGLLVGKGVDFGWTSQLKESCSTALNRPQMLQMCLKCEVISNYFCITIEGYELTWQECFVSSSPSSSPFLWPPRTGATILLHRVGLNLCPKDHLKYHEYYTANTMQEIIQMSKAAQYKDFLDQRLKIQTYDIVPMSWMVPHNMQDLVSVSPVRDCIELSLGQRRIQVSTQHQGYLGWKTT